MREEGKMATRKRVNYKSRRDQSQCKKKESEKSYIQIEVISNESILNRTSLNSGATIGAILVGCWKVGKKEEKKNSKFSMGGKKGKKERMGRTEKQTSCAIRSGPSRFTNANLSWRNEGIKASSIVSTRLDWANVHILIFCFFFVFFVFLFFFVLGRGE